MAAMDFLPSTDSDLLTFCTSFDTKINADPASYGITIVTAAAYTPIVQAFADALALTTDVTTNSTANVGLKNIARAALEDETRTIVRQIQGTATVTDAQRVFLGITVRDTDPTPVPTPVTAPSLTIESTVERLISVRLQDVDQPASRSKPFGVVGANLMMFVGDTPSSIGSDWSFVANVTRPIFDVAIDDTVPGGSKVWLRAMWFNTRGETSEPSVAQFTNISGLAAAA